MLVIQVVCVCVCVLGGGGGFFEFPPPPPSPLAFGQLSMMTPVIIGRFILFPFGTSAGDEILVPVPGALDATSDGTNMTCTYFQIQEDTIFVSCVLI